jgi:hypothetical protein
MIRITIEILLVAVGYYFLNKSDKLKDHKKHATTDMGRGNKSPMVLNIYGHTSSEENIWSDSGALRDLGIFLLALGVGIGIG